ncbi:MAG: helix-turn-helix domain-containing protein, partial [SAR324 cluster bacterium]|nr:helix-turn-helix domain-containing protein [SAR324 cluster bacterium]
INFRMLEDIEAGILREEPGPVFVRGFIRSYARQVGMNDQEIQGENIKDILMLQRPC